MPFNRDTINTIIDRIEKGIEARLFGKLAMLRTSVLRILARVFAGAIHGCYGYLEWITKQLFVTTCEEWYLENVHGLMWDVKRKAGSYATGTVIFSGSGATIPAGTLVQTEDGIEYGTLTEVILVTGTISADVQAVESGEDGNYVRPNPPDYIYLQLIQPITGVNDTVQVDGDITGGEDIEEVEDYRARILQRIQFTPAGGASADYDRWALEVSGVGRAWCYPLGNGPGTVVEVITATGSDPVPSSPLLAEVLTYINIKKPVTADLTVESITNYAGSPGKATITMSIDLYEDTSGSDYQALIIQNLTNLLLPHKPGTTIPISQIRAAISNTGVIDYHITAMAIDGNSLAINDIVLTGYIYPWLGTITFGVI